MKRVCGFAVSHTVTHYYAASHRVAWSVGLSVVLTLCHTSEPFEPSTVLWAFHAIQACRSEWRLSFVCFANATDCAVLMLRMLLLVQVSLTTPQFTWCWSRDAGYLICRSGVASQADESASIWMVHPISKGRHTRADMTDRHFRRSTMSADNAGLCAKGLIFALIAAYTVSTSVFFCLSV